MKLHTLKKVVAPRRKRLGLGYGSGKGGHTSSRGEKGQKSRNSVRLSFVGTSWVWFKRLPFIRGKSRFNQLTPNVTVTLDMLERFPAGSTVNKESLLKEGVISKTQAVSAQFKLVGTGTLTKKLIVAIPASAAAQKAVLKAAGEYRGKTA